MPSQALVPPEKYRHRLSGSLASSRIIRWAKAQAATYAHGEDRPLGAYLVLMGAYSALVASLATAVGILGKPVPNRIGGRDLILTGLATHKISRLLSKDPVTSPLRAPLTRFEGTSGEAELSEKVRGEGLRHAVGELVTCPFCLDQWVGTALIFGLVLLPRSTRLILSIFTVVTTADFVQHLYARLQD
jgi:hypothetical protein